MPLHSLDYEPNNVLPFMQALISGFAPGSDVRTIGLRRNGEMVAGVAYEGFNGRNIWMHVAALPGARWLTRNYLRACFAYPFLVCDVQRVSGYVNEGNALARRFNEHLGFTEETRLCQAAPDGLDVIIFVMWKQECRHVALSQD